MLRLSRPWRLAIAPMATVVGFLIQWVLLPDPDIAPFVIFTATVVLASWVGGLESGLLAVALSAAVANFAFIHPHWRWSTSGTALTATALFLVAGSIVALMCASFRDALLRAEQADRRKDEFLGMLSHELRNPLAPIRNSLDVLGRVAPGSDSAARSRAIIGRQVDHLTRLVGDLLDITRITRGTIQLERQPLDFAALVERTVEDHRPDFARRQVELEVQLPGVPVWVNGDATRLAQAVGNILQNAAKFTPAGGRVFVHLVHEGASTVLRVRDSGVGIAPEVMANLFEPFTQADQSLARTPGGLGLGLALVKRLVELQSGEVRARSEGVGRGAELTIRLPVQPAPRRAEAARAEPARPQRLRVLVIEDNVDAAESLKEALELEGHEVSVAFTGHEGLAAARAFAPHVVLCDIGLPGMDGYQLARTFRADEGLREIPLVAVTGYAAPEDREEAASAGFDHHVAKPPDLDALARILAGIHAARAS